MTRSLEYCPKCDTLLVTIGHTARMRCPNGACQFIDRRQGPSMAEPSHDRRGGLNRHQVARARAMGQDPWQTYKRWK